MIKCQLSDNGLVKISNDNIISQNPMLNIIKYHDYPYFMPSNNDGYQIRCGISNGIVYDCLLISEHAIKLLINEFKEVSQLDAVKNNENIDYELMLQFPILQHIQSSKLTYNTIYKILHQHLSILNWFEKNSQNLNAKKQPLRKHEDICVFYRKQPTYNPQMTSGKPYNKGIRKDKLTGSYGNFKPVLRTSDGERYPTDILYFKTAKSENYGNVLHPTQKPVELGRYLIRTYSNEGDLILDNTFGSGSFLLSAALENRNFCGIELNQHGNLFKQSDNIIDYVDLAKSRLHEIGVKSKVIREEQ